MFEFERMVYHCDAGNDGLLKVESAMAMMMDCCQFQEYAETKFSAWLRENNVAVFLASMQLDVLRRPAFREKLKVRVVIYDCQSIYGFRRITMRDEAGNLCMISNAVGCFFNFSTGRAAKLPANIGDYLQYDPAEPMETLPRKIALPADDWLELAPYTVQRSDLDLNHHLTSIRYLAVAGDRLPENFTYDRMRVEFKRQVKCGETVSLREHRSESDSRIVRLDDGAGMPCAVFEFSTIGQ